MHQELQSLDGNEKNLYKQLSEQEAQKKAIQDEIKDLSKKIEVLNELFNQYHLDLGQLDKHIEEFNSAH